MIWLLHQEEEVVVVGEKVLYTHGKKEKKADRRKKVERESPITSTHTHTRQ